MNQSPPDQTPEDRRKALRATIILYGAMFLLNAILFLVLWWTTRSK